LRLALIEAMGAHPSAEASMLLLELARDPLFTSAVAAALASSADESAIDFLIERLGTRRDRANAQRGLVRIGSAAQQVIEGRLMDAGEGRRVLLHLPLTLAKFENPAAVGALLRVLTSEQHSGFVRYKALRGLQEIAMRTRLAIDPRPVHDEIVRNAGEHLRLTGMVMPLRAEPAAHERTSLSLVLGLCEDKMAQAVDRLERLVQIAQRTDDVPGVFRALRSADRHERGQAAEYLDALARGWDRRREGRLAILLGLVFNEASDAERVRASIAFVGPAPASTAEAIQRVLDLGDPLLAAFARNARSSLPAPPAAPVPLLSRVMLEPGVT
jgi:hypothetical protein